MILAAGRGQRFGGLKQLAPVRSSGEAIMDLTAAAALDCGYSGVILVVREEIKREVKAHIRRFWPPDMPVEVVCQDRRPGTAAAVAAVGPLIDGPFAVANADDLYGHAALRPLLDRMLASPGSGQSDDTVRATQVLVTYKLANTIVGVRAVNRGLCRVGRDQQLLGIAEYRVTPRSDAGYDAVVLAPNDTGANVRGKRNRRLGGHEPVSMNLWGFQAAFLDLLNGALERFDPTTAPRPELLLPDVVGALLRSGDVRVEAVHSLARCIGITYAEDLDTVWDEIAGDFEWWRSSKSLAG